MKELARLVALYSKIDLLLEIERISPDGQAVVRVEANQVLNDQAYFLLCWGQLEAEIDANCRAAIRQRSAHADWQIRRPWYLYNPDAKRLSGSSFEDRTALVMDRNAGRGSPYARTMSHYEVRNSIAHGKLQVTRLDVPAFVQDCYVIQTALRRAT